MGRRGRKRLAQLAGEFFGKRYEIEGDAATSYVTIGQAASKDSDTWTTHGCDVTGKCPIAETPVVEIPAKTWYLWIELARRFNTEWLAYFRGRITRDNGAVVEGFYFPPQDATGAHVERVGDEIEPGIIGAVHSHVKMNAFWSAEDERHANWPVEIVLNTKGEAKCRVRHKLECGRYTRADAEIHVVQPAIIESLHTQLSGALSVGERLAKEKRKSERASYTPSYTPSWGGDHRQASLTGPRWDQPGLVFSKEFCHECNSFWCGCDKGLGKTPVQGASIDIASGKLEVPMLHAPSDSTTRAIVEAEKELAAKEEPPPVDGEVAGWWYV